MFVKNHYWLAKEGQTKGWQCLLLNIIGNNVVYYVSLLKILM